MRPRRNKHLNPIQRLRQPNTLLFTQQLLKPRQIHILLMSRMNTEIAHKALQRRHEARVRRRNILERFQLVLDAMMLESVFIDDALAVWEGVDQRRVDDEFLADEVAG